MGMPSDPDPRFQLVLVGSSAALSSYANPFQLVQICTVCSSVLFHSGEGVTFPQSSLSNIVNLHYNGRSTVIIAIPPLLVRYAGTQPQVKTCGAKKQIWRPLAVTFRWVLGLQLVLARRYGRGGMAGLLKRCGWRERAKAINQPRSDLGPSPRFYQISHRRLARNE